MITIKNNQKISFDPEQLKKNAHTILKHLGYDDFDLGILLADNKKIHELNKKYRDKDKPTDILSFPFYPELQAGEQIIPKSEDEKNLGDIMDTLVMFVAIPNLIGILMLAFKKPNVLRLK